MLTRIRVALGWALLAGLLTVGSVLAKGNFSFITVSGGSLADEVRLSDPALTEDFFTFADFYRNRADAPAEPGPGYEITRYYVDGYSESAFDRLHYYPETGYVYYDGIMNGSSEYDGHWYTARPEIRESFEDAVFAQVRLLELGTQAGSQAMVPPAEPLRTVAQTGTHSSLPAIGFILPVLAGAALTILVAFAVLRFRRPARAG